MSSFRYEDLDALEAQIKAIDPDDFVGDGEPLRVSRQQGMIVATRLDWETLRKMRTAARERGITQSEFIRQAILAATDHLE